MMHTRDSLLILGEMQHHQLSLRSNSGHPNRPLGGLRAECTEMSRRTDSKHHERDQGQVWSHRGTSHDAYI